MAGTELSGIGHGFGSNAQKGGFDSLQNLSRSLAGAGIDDTGADINGWSNGPPFNDTGVRVRQTFQKPSTKGHGRDTRLGWREHGDELIRSPTSQDGLEGKGIPGAREERGQNLRSRIETGLIAQHAEPSQPEQRYPRSARYRFPKACFNGGTIQQGRILPGQRGW